MAHFSKPQSLMTVLVALFALLQFTVAFQHGAAHQHVQRTTADDAMLSQIEEVADALNKRQSQRVAITGVCTAGTGAGGVCNGGRSSAPRLEIRQLARNADQWNLYLLGMERFQAKDKRDTFSYYQIAGIHGRPYVTWGGFPTPLLNAAGFCPHGQSLFGSWHRPYLAVFEQALYQSVLEVIATFPQSQQASLRNTASTLRIPYWDWAQETNGGPTVPTQLRDATVTVTKPSGRVTINNPLYSYSWGTSLPAEMGGGPQNSWPRTVRRPVSNPTRSNNNEMEARFSSLRVSLRDRVFALFAAKQSWGAVSTAAIGVRTDLEANDSFESIHDVVHVTAGGESGGHMYFLDVSSFDPIFWLHHTNIDRLLTMYQYISPNGFTAPGNINRGMAQWNQGEAKNVYSPLKPFTKDTSGNYFSSDDVKETRVLGYYYPETSDRSYAQVASAVTNLYGAGQRTLTKRTDEKTGQYQGRPLKDGDYHTVLEIISNKFAMKGSYTVHCFVGKASSNATAPYTNSTGPSPSSTPSPYSNSTSGEAEYDPSKDYTQQPNYVGSYGILGGSMAGAGNATYPIMTTGSLPLTTCLQGKEHYGDIKSLAPEHIEPYLKENMYYKVVGVDGELNPDDIPDFHVSVKCTKVTVAADEYGLPDLSATYQVLPDVTKDLPAGKPFTYKPTPIDIPVEDQEGPGEGYPVNGTPAGGKLPWQESGYCSNKQTIEYVDEEGNFLYSSM